jgi:XTP/dITP diphosphohydrolase
LLTWRAWQELSVASRVLAPSDGHPLLSALDEAGIGWTALGKQGRPLASVLAEQASRAEQRSQTKQRSRGQHPSQAEQVSQATVVWLCEPDPPGAPGQRAAEAQVLAREVGDLIGAPGHVEVLRGARDLPGGHLLRLVQVMDTLRTSCPWDMKQTHESLAPHLLEESYEAVDALESGDPAALREELGDVLLQVVFHARVAAERTDGTGYTVDDVADGIVAKLVRRHPHVFADVTVTGAEDVKRNWDAIKAAERESASGSRASALDGVPLRQPALALAAQLQRRAERAGVPAQLAEPAADADGIGAELFALVAQAREAGIDPELELRSAARRYRDRVHAWEAEQAAGPGLAPGQES